jgi:hypothetical protein
MAFTLFDASQINGVLKLVGGTLAGILNMGANKITGLANGTTSTDAVAFGQVSGTRILQVVTGTTTTITSNQTTSYINSNLTATITPTSASSRIRITVTSCVQPSSTTLPPTDIYTSIFRGGSSGTNLGDATKGFVATSMAFVTAQADQFWVPLSMATYDSPATTSATVYTVCFRASNTQNNVICNSGNGLSTIILEEIG